jgi:hypothetical protein
MEFYKIGPGIPDSLGAQEAGILNASVVGLVKAVHILKKNDPGPML